MSDEHWALRQRGPKRERATNCPKCNTVLAPENGLYCPTCLKAAQPSLCPTCTMPYHPSSHTEDEPCPKASKLTHTIRDGWECVRCEGTHTYCIDCGGASCVCPSHSKGEIVRCDHDRGALRLIQSDDEPVSLVAHDKPQAGADPNCGECDGTGVDFIETTDEGQKVHPCICVTRCQAKARAMTVPEALRFLFGLLDDIDTVSDMVKGNDAVYRKRVEAIQKRRWETGITSDGYTLNLDGVGTSEEAARAREYTAHHNAEGHLRVTKRTPDGKTTLVHDGPNEVVERDAHVDKLLAAQKPCSNYWHRTAHSIGSACPSCSGGLANAAAVMDVGIIAKSFVCPKCERESFSVMDVLYRYCGACCKYFPEPK